MVRLTAAGFTLVALLAGCGAEGTNPSGSGPWQPTGQGFLHDLGRDGSLDVEDPLSVGIFVTAFVEPSDDYVHSGRMAGDDIEFGEAEVPGQSDWVDNQSVYDDGVKGTWHRVDGFRITADNSDLGFLTNSNSNSIFLPGNNSENDHCPSDAEVYHAVMDEFSLVAYHPGDDVEGGMRSATRPYLGMPSNEPITDESSFGELMSVPIYDFVCDTFPAECVENTCSYDAENMDFGFSF